MTNKELIEDLLIEFDELDMQPMNIVPDPLDRAKAWKHELTYAIRHLKAEVAREIFEELEESIAVHAYTSKSEDYADGMLDAIEWVDSKIDELKKKHTEEKS